MSRRLPVVSGSRAQYDRRIRALRNELRAPLRTRAGRSRASPGAVAAPFGSQVLVAIEVEDSRLARILTAQLVVEPVHRRPEARARAVRGASFRSSLMEDGRGTAASQVRAERRGEAARRRLPSHVSVGAPGAWLALLPPGSGWLPKWSVSRVLSRRRVAAAPVGIIHLGVALLRRSSALTRALTLPVPERTGGASDGPSSTVRLFELAPGGACPPPVTRQSRVGSYPTISPLPVPPPRAVPLTASRRAHQPSAVCFLLRFPSGHPGSPLTTFLPCGARTFLPRTASLRRRSPDHLRPPAILPVHLLSGEAYASGSRAWSARTCKSPWGIGESRSRVPDRNFLHTPMIDHLVGINCRIW